MLELIPTQSAPLSLSQTRAVGELGLDPHCYVRGLARDSNCTWIRKNRVWQLWRRGERSVQRARALAALTAELAAALGELGGGLPYQLEAEGEGWAVISQPRVQGRAASELEGGPARVWERLQSELAAVSDRLGEVPWRELPLPALVKLPLGADLSVADWLGVSELTGAGEIALQLRPEPPSPAQWIHNDLELRNALIGERGELALIDWELCEWAPAHFEWAHTAWACYIEGASLGESLAALRSQLQTVGLDPTPAALWLGWWGAREIELTLQMFGHSWPALLKREALLLTELWSSHQAEIS